jgi:hypothetical protein
MSAQQKARTLGQQLALWLVLLTGQPLEIPSVLHSG